MIDITDLKIVGEKTGDTFTINITAQLNDVDQTELTAQLTTQVDYITNKRAKLISKCVGLGLEDILDKIKTLEKREEINAVEVEVKESVNQFKN